MRELEIKEKEEIRKILLRIVEFLRNNKDDILIIGEKVMYLDILNVKFIYVVENRCEILIVSNKEILFLEKVRYLFIDKDKVIFLIFEIGKDYDILFIIGLNIGGKIVVLKIVGFLILMVFLGILIFVFENFKIGFFEGVFVDIGDE